jgi:gamma-glutamyltranspeptidase/glutathione hydrolase
LQNSPNTEDYLPNGVSPQVGQIVQLKGLASTFRAIAEGGPDAFYTGAVADAIISTLQSLGGSLPL